MADKRVVPGENGTALLGTRPAPASRGRGRGEEPRPVQHAAVRTRETSDDLMPPFPACRPSTRHADLGEGFFDVVAPGEFPQHVLRYRTQRWAARVRLDGLTDEQWADHFGRFVRWRTACFGETGLYA